MHIRFRFWIRLIAAFITRFRVVIFAGVVIGLLFFVVFNFIAPQIFLSKIEYIGLTGRYHTDELPQTVLSLVGEGLTKISEDGTVEPALATRWEESEDGKVWTFFLKEGEVWHDNTAVDARSIKYSFEDATLEAVDNKTLRFTLNSPFAPFPAVVSRPTFKKGLLGTGEWRVAGLRLSGQYVERLTLRNENRETKILRFYPTEDATKTAYKLGQIDIISDVLDPKPFDSWNNTEVVSVPRNDRIVAVFFNNANDLFNGANNKPIRQALSYAVDKNVFNGERALGPISPDSWAHNPLVKSYDYDPARAKELIKDIPNLELTLTTTPALLNVAETVAKYWGEIGVKTNVSVISTLPDDYQAFLAIYDMPTDPDQYAVWHTTQTATNISKYSNPRIDKLLEDGRVELKAEERKKIYLDFQRFLLEDAPAVFLYHPVSYTVVRK